MPLDPQAFLITKLDNTIAELRQQLADCVLVATAKLTERDREIDLLTTERDNALLAAEGLELEIVVLTAERDNFGRDIETLRMQVGVLTAQAQEAELLTVERDNALLRVEELERNALQIESDSVHWRDPYWD